MKSALHASMILLISFVILHRPVIAAGPTAEDLRFFEAKIRPLLAEHCFECHGPKKQKGDLRLDSAAALQKGGYSEIPLIQKDKPEESLLLRAVRHAEDVEAMPPDRKLQASAIADLEQWVKRGAPFPAPVATAAEDPRKHWSFQPLGNPAVPEVKHTRWAKSDLDRFILARLEQAGLKPALAVNRRTWLRRVTFDLTGLPPTPEEIEAYVKDTSPKADTRVVDRLLASAAYGERWGRHWLDVARYADSNGLDENVAHGNAWRYRDYVIDSFNADKPYDRFLMEQIAGDLLPDSAPGTRHERLIATGFLALGPKVLAEPDEKKMEMDIIDEQLDTLGRTVLGLTIGCARCHDHKFDPLSTADYYGLAGIFASTRIMEHFKKVAKWYENDLATPAEIEKKKAHEAAVAKLKEKIKALTGKKDDAARAELKTVQAELAEREKNAPDVPSAMGATEGKPIDMPVLKRGNHLTPGAVVPRRFPVVLVGDSQPSLPNNQSGRLELANWIVDPANPLTARVIVNRVWRWHFGTGLVRSVDNFGLLGEKPSHPELLDWLARDFMQSGWSLKTLHRRIVLSATYRMSTAHNDHAARIDPDNRLRWRFDLHRLEAEVIRDSLLAVSGMLDRTSGGPALTHVKNRDYLFDHTSKDKTTYDSKRRSVYLPVIRNNLYDVFQLFDAPDAAVPSGDRSSTTVPTQALFFLNSDLVSRAADTLAERLLSRSEMSDSGRLTHLFLLTYGRAPTRHETESLLAMLQEFEKECEGDASAGKPKRKAWSIVIQAVLASNEFVHVQ